MLFGKLFNWRIFESLYPLPCDPAQLIQGLVIVIHLDQSWMGRYAEYAIYLYAKSTAAQDTVSADRPQDTVFADSICWQGQ